MSAAAERASGREARDSVRSSYVAETSITAVIDRATPTGSPLLITMERGSITGSEDTSLRRESRRIVE